MLRVRHEKLSISFRLLLVNSLQVWKKNAQMAPEVICKYVAGALYRHRHPSNPTILSTKQEPFLSCTHAHQTRPNQLPSSCGNLLKPRTTPFRIILTTMHGICDGECWIKPTVGWIDTSIQSKELAGTKYNNLVSAVRREQCNHRYLENPHERTTAWGRQEHYLPCFMRCVIICTIGVQSEH